MPPPEYRWSQVGRQRPQVAFLSTSEFPMGTTVVRLGLRGSQLSKGAS